MYDFDRPIERRNSNSLKWDVAEGELPMWVADMDFAAAPEIRAAIERRAAHGVFGYNIVPDAWYDAYIGWWKERHGFEIKKEWLIFCTGVVPALSSAVRKLTTPAEQVLIQTPVYNIFFNSIVNNGRKVLESPLGCDGDTWRVDFERLERDLADPQTTLMILCNPHNPVGKIWDRETLARIGELCKKHHVTVISDEIHCDLTDPGKSYVPFASVSDTCREICVMCVAPTKAFNLAGLQTAAVVVPDEALRNRMNRALNTDEVAEPNSFAIDAAVAAFTEGGPWLDELREYIYENKQVTAAYLEEQLEEITLTKSEATYLLWLDTGKIAENSAALAAHIRRETGLFVSDGVQYGTSGEHYLRLNIACPRSSLMDGLERLGRGIRSYRQ
ncbi:MAG: pyridoxal phosphate-dependent aminotransferase [Lachnospiraceae bacterium]|nr:pyridoxal phosphate-dependent aminotransferase [Lachnospiraceae bacterium]